MILRHQKQAVQAVIKLGVSIAVVLLCAALAFSMAAAVPFFRILLAVGFVTAGTAIIVYYCQFILCSGRARGYSPAFFATICIGPILAVPAYALFSPKLAVFLAVALGPLLPLLLALLLPDKSNPAKDEEDLRYPGARCVSCNGRIPATVKLCPHCGWTQPAGDSMTAAHP